MDLAKIMRECKAASIGLPRSNGSYKSRPWAYLSFHSEAAKDQAMDQQFTLRNRTLYWTLPDQVKTLCAQCGSDKHTAQACDSYASRGRNPTPKSLTRNYERFRPAGFKPSSQGNAPNKRNRSSSRSH